ncbi:MAG: hypothetical protein AAFW87_10115 [Pseudomonadota bacterium]
MTNWLVLLGVALVAYVGLVIVPRGRAALVACLAAGMLVGLLWLVLVFDLLGLAQSNPEGEIALLILVVGLTVAWGLACSMQAMRLRLPDHWPGWAWPLCATLALLTVAVPVLRFLGG